MQNMNNQQKDKLGLSRVFRTLKLGGIGPI